MNKLYSRIIWQNFPSEDTALNESNLNRMDLGLDNLDNRVIEMDATKVNKEVANSLVQSWSMDESTGIITITHLDGSKDMFDLNIEKIPVPDADEKTRTAIARELEKATILVRENRKRLDNALGEMKNVFDTFNKDGGL